MYLTVDDYDKNNYKLSGDFSKAIERVFKTSKEESRKSYLIPKKESMDKFLENVYDVIDVGVTFDYRDYNNFLGENILNGLFRLSYTSPSNMDNYDVASILDEIFVKMNRLPKSSDKYDEVIFTDRFFESVTRDFESNMRRANIKWYKFEDMISKDRGKFDELKELSKNLFVLNFATTVSKRYMRFVLNEFHIRAKRLLRIESSDLVSKTIADYLVLRENKNLEKAKAIYKNMPLSNLDVISYDDILELLNESEKPKEKERGKMLIEFLGSPKKRLSGSDTDNLSLALRTRMLLNNMI